MPELRCRKPVEESGFSLCVAKVGITRWHHGDEIIAGMVRGHERDLRIGVFERLSEGYHLHRLGGLRGRWSWVRCWYAPSGADESAEAVGDPLEPLNREVLAPNHVFDRAVLRPLATAYRTLPGFLRDRLRNVLDNLEEPGAAVNQVLQGESGSAASDAAHFVLNATIGVGGLFDATTVAGLVRHDEDFGQTLAVWGVPRGPYLEIRVIGPSTVRDGSATPSGATLRWKRS